ncbi:MAG: hypothetical protein SF182_15160 [Deltaproteobacteria bacterium]|nr:hypothetical protein [Deltaproteobacteria bacterium]
MPRLTRPAAARLATLLAAVLIAGGAAAEPAAEATRKRVTIEPETYRGWPDTYRVANGAIEARVVTAVGPRIIDLRAGGGENLFHVRPAEAGGRGEAEWMFRGGWRLWVAPETRATTYVPDNAPCAVAVEAGVLRVTGPPQAAAGIQKIVEVEADADQPCLHVRSRIKNIGTQPVRYAAWSLSVMRPGGRAFAPLDVGPLDAFDATRKLILWSYASLSDPRYAFGDRLVQIDHQRVPPAPTATGRRADESKIGVDSAQGWAAYLIDRTLYLKRFPHQAGAPYPDGGATIEIYSSAEFLEVENLSPLTTIQPGGELVYPEDWWVFPDVDIPRNDTDALEALRPFVEQTSTL